MKKKTFLYIGIALAIVAVAAFFLSKKKDSAATEAPENDNVIDLNSTDSIIDNLSLSSDLKKKAKGWVKEINKCVSKGTNKWDRKELENSAKDKGITYAQQLVTSALWQMYETAKVLTRDQFNTYYNELVSFGE